MNTSSANPDEAPDDPWLWLEDVGGEQALAWVRKRNAESVGEIASRPEFPALEQRARQILDSRDNIPFIHKHGDRYYNLWRDENNPRGLWRRTTLDEYRKAEPEWETVLDIDALGRDENENWVFQGGVFLYPTYDRALVLLSRGGADAVVVREFDVLAKRFVDVGFTLPESKTSICWKDRDTLLVGTDFGDGSMTTSGYPRIVREWRRGTDFAASEIVFEGKTEDMRVSGYFDPTPGFEREIITRVMTFYANEVFVRRPDATFAQVDKPDDASVGFHREWMFFELRTDWPVGGKTWKAGSLLAIAADAFAGGDRNFDLLFEPGERRSLVGYGNTRNYLILNEMDNVCSQLFVLAYENGKWTRTVMSAGAPFASSDAWGVDAIESDDYLLTTSGFVTPGALLYGSFSSSTSDSPAPLKSQPAFFDARGLAVSQHDAVSQDGTRVPYFMIARENIVFDGTNPTLLYGYGGFQIPLRPGYNALAGAGWIEKGGVYVVANIRGGGEFGPAWHQAAMREHRPRAYEDFAAVAEDLIRRKVTTAGHLGAQGASNGGLLVGNMLTTFPHLFGAVICSVPLLDMKRYNHLLAGASWMEEYGNPDDPEQWKFIATFSPYHNVLKERRYPRTLFTTSTRDDRVHPGHARKMAAKMLAMGHDILLYENIEGGHGGAADNAQLAFMVALAYTFLWKQLA